MSELDQTIEELESEVLAELEEASQPDDTGGKSDAPKKVKDEVNDVEDLGGADPEAKVEKDADEDREEKAIGKKASAAAKAIKGDAQQKSAGKSDAPQKLAAGDEVMHDGEKISEEDIEEKMSEKIFLKNLRLRPQQFLKLLLNLKYVVKLYEWKKTTFFNFQKLLRQLKKSCQLRLMIILVTLSKSG
jgi:hypothetical protein